jgi:hypothetical protein
MRRVVTLWYQKMVLPGCGVWGVLCYGCNGREKRTSLIDQQGDEDPESHTWSSCKDRMRREWQSHPKCMTRGNCLGARDSGGHLT